MKIAFLSLYNGTVFRGVESWTSKIVKYMKINNQEVLLVQGGLVKEDNEDYIKSVNIHAKDYSGNNNFVDKVRKKLEVHKADFDVKYFYRKSIPYLLEFKPDIIIPLHGKVQYLKKLLSGCKNIKFVGVGHAGIPKDVKYYDGFVALTNRDMKQIQEIDIPKRYITNGVELSLFQNVNKDMVVAFYKKIRNKYGHIENPLVLTVSALVEYKRIDLAIRAIEKMGRGTLIIAGDGPERRRLQKIAEDVVNANKNIKVIFIDKIDYNDMPLLYKIVDVFTHPADENEAFGSVIIEAMASGLPVIVNDDKARRDIVSINDYVVDPTNIDCYVEKLEENINNKTNFTKISTVIAKKFDWSIICKQYITFLNEVNYYSEDK